MRILFVTPYVPSLIRVRPYNFIRELARRQEVHLVSASSADEARHALELSGICGRVALAPLTLRASAISCALAALRGEPLQAAYCRSAPLSAAVARALSQQAYDIVHVEHLRAAHLRQSIPAEMPALYDAVDCISLLLERTLHASHSVRQRLVAAVELERTRRYEARLVPQFDAVVATSREDAASLEALAPGARVGVVPNGVDLDYFRPLAQPPASGTMVISGKMSYHANVTAVLHFVEQILPLVRRYHPRVRLRIVGSAPPAAIRELARDPGIEVTGYLPDIREAVGTAAVALCPVTVKVGVQNKILEAMAMGVPVVSSREGASGLSFEAGRDALVAENAEEFAAKIARLLTDDAYRAAVGLAGRRFVERNHRWEDVGKHLEAEYATAIRRHGKRPDWVL